jgi:hypothetical protein
MRAARERRALTLHELLLIVVVIVALIAGLAAAVYLNRPGRGAGGDSAKTGNDAGPTGKPPEAKPTRPDVLFVGNSYTFAHHMPYLVKALARAAGEKPDLGVDMHAPGGATWQQHYEGGAVAQRLKLKKYDYVVLQERSAGPLDAPADMHKYGQLLDEEVRKSGAKTILFLTWAYQHIPIEQDQITREYKELAQRQQAKVAPVGQAWQAWLRDYPNVALHDPDKSHPNPRGAYLTACVFYATIYGKSPVGLPGTLKGDNGEPLSGVLDNEARLLQQTAWDAVQGWKQ